MISSNVRDTTNLRFIKEIMSWQEKLALFALIAIPITVLISFDDLTSMIDASEFSTFLLFIIGACFVGLLLRLRTLYEDKVVYKLVYDKNNRHDQSRSWFKKNYIVRDEKYNQAMESFMTHLQSAIIMYYRIPPTKLDDINSLFHFKNDESLIAKEPYLYKDILTLEVVIYPIIEYILSDKIRISDTEMIKFLDIATWKMHVLFETNEDVLSYIHMVLVDMVANIEGSHN